jgi:transcriptional regulator with XRE-family HTH domain
MYEIFEQLLQKHGVTPYQVSKETGISQTTLSDWKRGRSEPKPDKIRKIADYFCVPITRFYPEPVIIETSQIDEDGQVERLLSYNKGVTIAAHKEDDENWTVEELKKIEEYKQLLMAARKNKK